MDTRKIQDTLYISALALAGFRTIKAFCDHYGLNHSTITKIINGDDGNNYIGDTYIANFKELIGEELDYVLKYPPLTKEEVGQEIA